MNKALSARHRSSRMRSRVSIIVAASMATVVLAACSSSGGSTQTQTSSGSTLTQTSGGSTQTGTTGGSTGGANVAEAKTLVAKYQAPLTSFNLQPLKSAPPRNKKIAVVTNNAPNSLANLDGIQKGAEALGWTTIPIVYDPSKATGLQDAFAQAVQDNPDGVVTYGVDVAQYSQAAKQLAAKNIPVVTYSTADVVGPPLIANVTDANQTALAARILANYVVAQKGADANVAMFNIPSLSILAAFETAFKAEYLRLCPSCKFKSVPIQFGDIGTKVPAQVASTIQTDPKINFAVMGFGSISTGVSAALRTAGISGVQIVGEAPGIDNISSLISGSEDMWVGYPLYGMGWKAIDALARYFNKENTAIDTTAPTPFRILTKANAPQPAASPEVQNYQAYFKGLWHVG